MFDFPLALLEPAGVVVADVVPAPELPELIVEMALEVEELGMDEAVILEKWAVEPDVMIFAAGDGAPVVGVDPVGVGLDDMPYEKISKESEVVWSEGWDIQRRGRGAWQHCSKVGASACLIDARLPVMKTWLLLRQVLSPL